jgi:uncharacterized SAM-binding protein YcdF (DUF218 family)
MKSSALPRTWRPSWIGLALGGAAGLLARDLALDSFASFWVPAGLLAAGLWPTRLRPVVAVAAAAVAALWLAVAFTPVSARLARGLVRRDRVVPADAILVLGSRLQADGEVTAADLSRLVHALELGAQGLGPRLVVTEPAPAKTRLEAARRAIAALGLQVDVVSAGPARTTREEAAAVAALCRAQGWHRLIVVTSPLHSRRACAAVEHEGLQVSCSPAAETEYDLETLDRPVERLAAFRAVLHERVGTWVYARRGWLAPSQFRE